MLLRYFFDYFSIFFVQKLSLNTKVISAEFMKEHNSFLIPIDGLEPVKEGAFAGHLWASPSVEGLREIMRKVVADPAAARAVGRQGSLDVRSKYNPAAVAQVLRARLEQIQETLFTNGEIEMSRQEL